eukprot:XP_001693797.1 predicted protein [Chlamydomonas reinhardtii]
MPHSPVHVVRVSSRSQSCIGVSEAYKDEGARVVACTERSRVYFPGRAMHGACGQWIDIKMAAGQSDGTVNAQCEHCSKRAKASIKKWGLKEGIDLCG